jgi:hypothetical protein
MSIPLQDLADNTVADRNFRRLAQLVIDTGGRDVGVRFGVASTTFTASTLSTPTTVTHGLGRTPVVAFAGTENVGFTYSVTARTSTTITVQGFTSGAVSQTNSFDWFVIG